MKILSRLKTTAFDYDLIAKNYKILQSEIKDAFKKDAKNICPHGKMSSDIIISFNTNKDEDIYLIEELSITFDYGGDKQIRLKLSQFGSVQEILIFGVPTNGLESKDFDKYRDILEDYVYLMNKGVDFASSDFEAVDRKCSIWLREQGK